MAAEVESLFFVRKPCWHGLGTRVEEAPSSSEAIKLAGLDWIVEPRPIYLADGTEIIGQKANVRSIDQLVLGIVSDRYQIVQNSEAFQFVDELLGEGVTFETAGSLRCGKVIWLLAHMPKTKILDDELEPYLCFTNTHDGTGAIRVCATPTRVCCMNTLNFALNTAKRSWSTKHMGDIQGRLIEARTTLGLANNYISALQQDAEVLAAQKITDAEVDAMLDAIYLVKEDDSDIRKARIAKAKESFFTCLSAPDIANYKGTAFAVMNAATDFVDHAQPMRLTQNFEENRWGQIIVGHPFVDQMYKMIKAA